MKAIWQILLWIWQTPQNLIGIIARLIYPSNAIYRGVDVSIVEGFHGGICLGRTFIINRSYFDDPSGWNHEYGHTRQSLYLGPLYLFVIGIPSLLWAWYWNPSRGVSYYSFYTEKWANLLGGIK